MVRAAAASSPMQHWRPVAGLVAGLGAGQRSVVASSAGEELSAEVVDELEQLDDASGGSPAGATIRPRMASVQTYSGEDGRAFQVTLAVAMRLWERPEQLEQFVRSRPEPTSMPFLLWLSDMEAAASGERKMLLAALCEQLVIYREQLDQERMEQLYESTLGMLADDAAEAAGARHDRLLSAGQASTSSSSPVAQLAGGVPLEGLVAAQTGLELQLAVQEVKDRARQEALSLLYSSPELYSAMLAEKLTSSPVTVDGFDPLMDLILQAAPPASLTAEGVRKAHEEAKELASDMKQRRKRSVASIIGRAQLTPEQAEVLKAGSAASRILDMLVSLPDQEQRRALLPDCFTAPAAGDPAEPRAADAEDQDQEELWCSPSQLLSEVEARIQRASRAGPGPQDPGRAPSVGQAVLPPGQGLPSGPELLEILHSLRDEIRQSWLDSMGRQLSDS
jgi:hypothetical protein